MGKGTFSCVKWLLTVFNFVFLACGLAICAFSIWMLVSPSMAQDLIGKNLTPVVAYILLGCGGTIILISFCGCAGAGLENRCLLCLFFTVLCGIFVACLVASILVSIFRKDLSILTTDRLASNLKHNYGNSLVWTEFWDLIQTKFSCCAVEIDKAIMVYQKTPWYNLSKSAKVPSSCCATENGYIKNSELCQKGNLKSMHETGCMSAILGILIEQHIIMLSILVTLAVVLICGMSLSLAHLRNIINIRYHDYSHPI